jgi:hypothetical protein
MRTDVRLKEIKKDQEKKYNRLKNIIVFVPMLWYNDYRTKEREDQTNEQKEHQEHFQRTCKR